METTLLVTLKFAKDKTASKGDNKPSNPVIDDKSYRHLMGLGIGLYPTVR